MRLVSSSRSSKPPYEVNLLFVAQRACALLQLQIHMTSIIEPWAQLVFEILKYLLPAYP